MTLDTCYKQFSFSVNWRLTKTNHREPRYLVPMYPRSSLALARMQKQSALSILTNEHLKMTKEVRGRMIYWNRKRVNRMINFQTKTVTPLLATYICTLSQISRKGFVLVTASLVR